MESGDQSTPSSFPPRGSGAVLSQWEAFPLCAAAESEDAVAFPPFHLSVRARWQDGGFPETHSGWDAALLSPDMRPHRNG